MFTDIFVLSRLFLDAIFNQVDHCIQRLCLLGLALFNNKLQMKHILYRETSTIFSFPYLPPSWVPDKKIDLILSTMCVVTRKRRAGLTHH